MFNGIKSFFKRISPDVVFIVLDLNKQSFVDEFVKAQLNSRRDDHVTIAMKSIYIAVDIHRPESYGTEDGSISRGKIQYGLGTVQQMEKNDIAGPFPSEKAERWRESHSPGPPGFGIVEIGNRPRSEKRELVVIEFALSYVTLCKKSVCLQRFMAVEACGNRIGDGVEDFDFSWKFQFAFFAGYV